MLTLGIIGHGAIGRVLASACVADPRFGLRSVLIRRGRVGSVRGELPQQVRVVEDIVQLLDAHVDVVVECASHGAVEEYGVSVLSAGSDLVVISTGALASETLYHNLSTAARRTGSRVVCPSGAIAGIDGLAALRVAGLHSVKYVCSKPPHAWLGTPAQAVADLRNLESPLVVFDGSAREAARSFPKNANIAMTVALAGIGPDNTHVVLVADPGIAGNAGRIVASGESGELDVTLEGAPLAENPKTSAITAHSILHALGSRLDSVVI